MSLALKVRASGLLNPKYANPLQDTIKSIANTEAAYRKTVSTSDNTVMIFLTSPDKAMDPFDVQGLIDSIHSCLSETQGIIEAKKGITKRGYRYIYSIVKNLSSEQFGGVRYFLRLNLFFEKQIIEVQADFTEIGMTGVRESVCANLAQKAGLIDGFENGFTGWSQDPYDPDFKNGCLKNLAEREGLDGLFPDSPLSQAHEFLLAILNDELVTTRKNENNDIHETEDAEQTESNSDETPEEKAEKEKRLLMGLFEDECRRYSYAAVVK